ncbi:MAG TPA: hypothetical protein IGS52_24320 [Oscillatoriaceae cyanobacterium M33_DOE_052]|nr:hypothetical protein [Oscillatoriaceae cyanobacterium M33_DOE_052]
MPGFFRPAGMGVAAMTAGKQQRRNRDALSYGDRGGWVESQWRAGIRECPPVRGYLG